MIIAIFDFLENDVNVRSKVINILKAKVGSWSILVIGTNPCIRIRTKMSRIHNAALLYGRLFL